MANLCGEDQGAHKQLMKNPFNNRNIQMFLRPLQIEQRDENRRGTRLAPPDDIQHKLFEATTLVVHPIGQSQKTRTRILGRLERESMCSDIGNRIDDVICDAEVS